MVGVKESMQEVTWKATTFRVGDTVTVNNKAYKGYVYRIEEFTLKAGKYEAQLDGATDPEGEPLDEEAFVFVKDLAKATPTPKSTPNKAGKGTPKSAKKRAKEESEESEEEETKKNTKKKSDKKKSPAAKKVKQEEEKTTSTGRPSR